MAWGLGLGRLRDGAGPQNRCWASSDSATRTSRRAIGSPKYLGNGSTGMEATICLLHDRTARSDRETDRRRKYSRHQFFRFHRLVVVANDLLTETPSLREKSTRRLGLDPGRTLFERSGPLPNHTLPFLATINKALTQPRGPLPFSISRPYWISTRRENRAAALPPPIHHNNGLTMENLREGPHSLCL